MKNLFWVNLDKGFFNRIHSKKFASYFIYVYIFLIIFYYRLYCKYKEGIKRERKWNKYVFLLLVFIFISVLYFIQNIILHSSLTLNKLFHTHPLPFHTTFMNLPHPFSFLKMFLEKNLEIKTLVKNPNFLKF